MYLLFSAADNDATDPPESKDPEECKNKEMLAVCTVSIVCSCGKDPTTTIGQKCQSFGHTATLLIALSVNKGHLMPEDAAKTGNKDDSCLTFDYQLCPYILVYDILTANNETSAKLPFNVDSSIELEKEMMLQDPYTPSGSDDDWLYDQLPVLPPDTLHSSVLQKFAEAISGEENGNKGKAKKPTEETNKFRKLIQCQELSGVCKGQNCKISEIVPFGDGQNLLVNFVCCGSCSSKTNDENEETVEISAGHPNISVSDSGQGNHDSTLIHEHNFTQSTLAVCRIVTSNGERTLSLQPTRTKQFPTSDGILSSIVALPVESRELLGETNIHFQEPEAELSSASQLLVGAANGSIVVIDANSLNVLTKFTSSNDSSTCKITHILNCPGMDCFCACMEDGMMRFLGLRNQLMRGTDISTTEGDRTDGNSELSSGGSSSQQGKIRKSLP